MLHVVQNWIFWGFPESWEVAIHTPLDKKRHNENYPTQKLNSEPTITPLSSVYHAITITHNNNKRNKNFLTYVIKASHSKKFSSDSGPLNKQKPLFNWII